ncbi:MAG: dephospho-CoA kinase [Oligoflexia bacterium]|nr:dephospho-CoA kinase [Oligoflexia bacterium]
MQKNLKLKSRYITLNGKPRIYNSNIPVVGLTGGIASGKSTVSNILRDNGLTVICGDTLTKEIYKEKESIDFIKDNFPTCITADSEIDFSSLRKEFFNNPKSKQLIENYIWSKHPIFFHKFINKAKAENQNFIIYDYPIIFEQTLHHLFDIIFVVYTDKETQKKRLKLRDKNNMSDLLIEKILSTQMPMEQMIKLVDSKQVINNCNNCDNQESLQLEVKRILQEFFA